MQKEQIPGLVEQFYHALTGQAPDANTRARIASAVSVLGHLQAEDPNTFKQALDTGVAIGWARLLGRKEARDYEDALLRALADRSPLLQQAPAADPSKHADYAVNLATKAYHAFTGRQLGSEDQARLRSGLEVLLVAADARDHKDVAAGVVRGAIAVASEKSEDPVASYLAAITRNYPVQGPGLLDPSVKSWFDKYTPAAHPGNPSSGA